MTITYQSIATYTVSGSAATSYTFSSIPATYTDLVLVTAGIGALNGVGWLTFNGDSPSSGTNYSNTVMYGDGSTGSTYRRTNQARINDSYYYNNVQQNNIYHFMSYANTNTYKTVLIRSSNASTEVNLNIGLWRSTAAINSLTLTHSAGAGFAIGTTMSLYGIKAE